MSKYRIGVMNVEAITFDELVAYGLQNAGAHIHNGMPWSFEYKGRRITHETDDWYLVDTIFGTMNMKKGDMLVSDWKGELYPIGIDFFEKHYTKILD